MTTQQAQAIDDEAGSGVEDVAEAAPELDEAARAQAERRRIEEQLAHLEKKQAELRRALAMTEHPELADAIREIEGRTFVIARAEERLAQPLTKSEERQRAKLESKLEGAKAKRAELDDVIATLEGELAALCDERLERLREERESALEILFRVLARHADGFEAAGLQMTTLVPELERWLPELRAMAEARMPSPDAIEPARAGVDLV